MNKNTVYVTLVILSLVLGFSGICFGIKTDKVSLGRDGVYDGKVYVERSTGAEMVFKDDVLSSPVTLSDLASGTKEHGDLLGLEADDHPQYLTETRHLATHDVAFNDNLPVSADVNGNTLLKDHLGDTQIHLNRSVDEHVSGLWQFTNGLAAGQDFYIIEQSPTEKPSLRFGSDAGEARMQWDSSQNRLEFTAPVDAAEAAIGSANIDNATVSGVIDGKNEAGQPWGRLENFAWINGIAGTSLVDKTADEDVQGQWDFLKKVNVIHSPQEASFNETGVASILTTEQESAEDISGIVRAAGEFGSSFTNVGEGAVMRSRNVGVRGEAISGGSESAAEEVNHIGVLGTASARATESNVIGVAGVAPLYKTSRSRIGVFGSLDSGFVDDPTSVPLGEWAGYFDGNVAVNGTLTVGKTAMMVQEANIVKVAKSGTTYSSIQAAIDSITDSSETNPYIILIYPGVYDMGGLGEGQILLDESYVYLVGINRDACIITANRSHTLKTDATLRITASNSGIFNLTVKNVGLGPDWETAVYIDDNTAGVLIKDCYLDGQRDTVWIRNNATATIRNCELYGRYDMISVNSGGTGYVYYSTLGKKHNVGSAWLWTTGSGALYLINCYAYSTVTHTNTATLVNMNSESVGSDKLYAINTHLYAPDAGARYLAWGNKYQDVYFLNSTNELSGNLTAHPLRDDGYFDDIRTWGNSIFGDDHTADTHSVKGNTTIKLSDNAGVGKVAVQDSDGSAVAEVNSDGVFDGSGGYEVDGSAVVSGDGEHIMKVYSAGTKPAASASHYGKVVVEQQSSAHDRVFICIRQWNGSGYEYAWAEIPAMVE